MFYNLHVLLFSILICNVFICVVIILCFSRSFLFLVTHLCHMVFKSVK